MVYNCFIRCHVCGSITRVRLQVGWQEEHPIVVACRKCGISLNGKVKIGQDMPGLEFSFENAEILREDESADYVVECSGEFPTKKLSTDEREFVPSPFMRNQSRMQENNGYEKFTRSVSRLMETAQSWAQYKRILDLSQNGNKGYLIQEVKKLIPEQFAPGTNELEILRAVHLVEIMGFITPLRDDVISEHEVSDSVLKLDFDQIRELIEYLNAHEGYRLEDLQSTIYQMLSEFIEVYQYLIPAFATQFCKADSIDFAEEGSTTSSFDLVKQFYLDTYETLGNLLIIPAAIDNIKNRDDANNFINNDAGIVSLDKFITSSKAHRFRLYNTNEIYMRTIDVRYNQKLRNAIGHNDVEYETSTQKIIYIPDPRKREKKLSEYLLEFEIEALSMFKTVLVISEYLYRLRELELLSKGVKPLPVEFPTKERRKEKIYPNEKCPCGSGLKYKKCHGRIF